MTELPEYRVRLFLAIDLVGSTAFKANKDNQEHDGEKMRPKWVVDFDQFYREFPNMVRESYEKAHGTYDTEPKEWYPKLWKTIGDEVILCCRVSSKTHIKACVEAFLSSLEDYSKKLRSSGKNLDVKGNMWVATFPTPNVSIPLKPEIFSEDDNTASEAIESRVDDEPHLFDFLGKAIDTGFRLAKHSAAGKCSLSVQLAHVLTEQNIRARGSGREVRFHGKDTFKGVNDGIEYPCLSISTETREAHNDLHISEGHLTGTRHPDADVMKTYLDRFMQVAEIEQLWLPNQGNEEPRGIDKPESYCRFESDFQKLIDAQQAAEQIEEQSLVEPAGEAMESDSANGESLEAAADELLSGNSDE